MVRRWVCAVSAVTALLAVAACSGSSAPPPAASSNTPPATQQAAPTLPAGAPAPPALRGSWVDVDNTTLSITLRGRDYVVADATGHVGGSVSVRGHDLFLFSAPCGDVIGHYRWAVAHGRLRFTAIDERCPARRGAFVQRTFRRQ